MATRPAARAEVVVDASPEEAFQIFIEVSFEPVGEGTLVRLEQTGFERVPEAAKYLPGYDAGWKEVLGWFAQRVTGRRR